MFSTRPPAADRAGHDGYVAGRYRNGAVSDSWTDVDRCADGTFVRYLARCECGWVGRDRPATPAGAAACSRELLREHVLRARPMLAVEAVS